VYVAYGWESFLVIVGREGDFFPSLKSMGGVESCKLVIFLVFIVLSGGCFSW
jgi:hypothetical protein